MLEILNIKKDYVLKDQTVNALKGVSICFRKSEFVSILGPSGCGKTTLLNIIGGLDRYTDGDLVIDGVSTKQFKDRDWDNYRNHRVGFVFQSYNLIPHQTVLQNVELALTLSGVSKKERKQRAVEVLERVGLGDKLKSKPNQLSGGQMQRVAIARALVNDPEIILADEPTGALDSKTSVQIMELLKEVSKNKLVIMVTHNPDLAEQYSSRIIKLKDGELLEDSKPYSQAQAKRDLLRRQERAKLKKIAEQENASKQKNVKFKKTEKKKSMSFFTALALSFKNLLTKKARTLLVAFAGSIGIIGIALVLALSNGFSSYINKMQEDTLSTYPITIEAKSVDFTTVIMEMFLGGASGNGGEHDKDAVYPKDSISNVLDSVGNNLQSNDLTKFKAYLEENYARLDNDVSAVQYTYDLNLEFNTVAEGLTPAVNVQPNSNAVTNMITKYSVFFFENKTNIRAIEVENGSYRLEKQANTDYTFIDQYPTLEFVRTTLEDPEGDGTMVINSQQVYALTFALLGMNSGSGMASMMGFGNMNIFNEMLNNSTMIKSQYTLVGENSRFAENADEAILVLDKNQELDEYILYAMGLLDNDDINSILKAKVKGDTYHVKVEYDEILNKEYSVIDEADYFVDIDNSGTLTDIRTLSNNEKALHYENILQNASNKFKIVGIVRLNDNTNSGGLKAGIAYTSKLTEQMINYHNAHGAVVAGQLDELSLDTPATINIYVNSFESKEVVQKFIEDYNAQAGEGEEIKYTDMVGIIMSTVSIIINSITYVLIAFVSVSLIVSSIMIGIITYISVIERTKEIGVLRSVGASKRDIKRVFTAESFIIGLTSGVVGIVITFLAILPINVIIKKLTGIAGLAVMPWLGAGVLILISVLLTFVAGLFPARIASKKDPVIALRSE